MSETGEMLGATYRRLARIGSGGMGDVYEVEHVRLQTRFAAKVLRCGVEDTDGKRRRFLREARLLAQLKSDHIVRVFDVSGDEQNPPFYVMELLDGQDLRGLLQSEQQLSVARAVKIILDACLGVGVAHAAGLVHRDLKPENLFLTHRDSGEEICKLLDFGVSKGTAAASTETGGLVGTIAYMAPEQVESAATVTAQADVYSLGAILYELLAGRPPYRADSVERLLFKILSGAPEPIATLRPDLPLDLQRTVHRALARRASDRFAGVSELVLALRSQDFGGGATPTLRDERRESQVAPFALSARRTLPLGVLAMAAVLGGSMLLSSRTPGRTTGPPRNAQSMLPSAKESTNTSDSSSDARSTTDGQTATDVRLSAVAVPAELKRPLTPEPQLAAPPLVKARARRIEGAPGGPRAPSNVSVAPVPEIRIEVQNPYAR